MKRDVIVLLLLLVIFAGCQDSSSPLSPITETNLSEGEPNWISLPQSESLLKRKKFSVKKRVKMNKDTELIIDRSYKGGIHGEVKVIAKLKFYKGTVKKDVDVTMDIDVKKGILSFKPSMTFNKDVELYVKFEGLDLRGLSKENIDFVYLAKDGSVESINYKEIVFDKSKGILELKEGQIPHFSRYGWTRTRK